MNIIEIISGVLLILSCIAIVLAVMFQEAKTGLSGSVGGNTSESFFSGNKTMTNQGMLSRITKICTIILVILTLVVNGVNLWMK